MYVCSCVCPSFCFTLVVICCMHVVNCVYTGPFWITHFWLIVT